MFRSFSALDPRRSLATAVAWLAVALSLTIALALVAVGDYAANSMLAQRDALLKRFASQVAAELERALVNQPGESGSAPHLPSQERLAALIDDVRERVKPDPLARVLLLNERHGIVFERPSGSPLPPLAPVLPGVAVLPADDGQRTLVVSAPRDAAPALSALGMHVAVVQPAEERGHGGGGSLQEKLTAISILLSITAALVGAMFARRLTRRLGELTAQVRRVARQEADGIVEPKGRDEVAVLGRAFSRLLQAQRQEHDELDRLTQELEQRVQARTREVERLAADSRYAAVVRERLRLARDLHDTLAHSMMEMLVEVRTLRMLHAHDPQKLGAELERAEEVARQGIKEAREAVSQMRLNAVRDLGLGAALGGAVNRFAERTGLDVRFSTDPQAATFADPRAETLFRIAEEVLRNIDRHAQASHVQVALKDLDNGTIELAIADDGVGFDLAEPHPGHYGLVGISEQAQLIDAELELRSAPGAGTAVRLRLRVGPEMSPSNDRLGHAAHTP
ncbi:sensor histidine kinase [Azohydromonas caseinilytica]|uniref:histidine kinase n=1 Tax=Azohydromonas caseinilytica TaxID=2728836 RepID=A0A848FHR0_9BURK|nr:histidine kinase [Azohydromonas caseinilytica]NML18385.1 HAMP domain-containing protein [Azohydromonas caseinilytica]